MQIQNKLMPGSQTGPSYLLIARRGDVALGIKMLGVLSDPIGQKGRSYMACRLRSAPYGGDLEHAEQQDTVVSMADHGLTLTTAWPDIKFDKVSAQRASALLGFFVRGDPEQDPVATITAVLDGDGIASLVDLVVKRAGLEHMVLRRQAIIEWAKGEIVPVLLRTRAKAEAAAKFSAQAEQTIGIAGFQAAQLHALYASTQAGADDNAAALDELEAGLSAKAVKKPKAKPAHPDLGDDA